MSHLAEFIRKGFDCRWNTESSEGARANFQNGGIDVIILGANQTTVLGPESCVGQVLAFAALFTVFLDFSKNLTGNMLDTILQQYHM